MRGYQEKLRISNHHLLEDLMPKLASLLEERKSLISNNTYAYENQR
jgi:hypothetical protein